jgi:hypothetical protein
MTFSALKYSRTRLLALMLVAVLGVSSAAVASIASASSGSAAAKKSKKCKKGYKKVHGKCKKKKKAVAKPAPAKVLTGATLQLVKQQAATKFVIKGHLDFSTTPAKGIVPAVVNVVDGTGGVHAININIDVDGISPDQDWEEWGLTTITRDPTTATMSVLGITTNQVVVK